MATENGELHIFFFPLMVPGHMIPILDMARLFAAQGCKITIITTPQNAPLFTKPIQRSKILPTQITIRTIKFPSAEVGLPEDFENLDLATSQDFQSKFIAAMGMLTTPLENLLNQHRPHALVADMFFPWTTDLAAKFGIPRIVFQVASFFYMCTWECLMNYKPYKNVSSDSEPFVLPNLPDQIMLTKLQLPDHIREEFENDFSRLLDRATESERRSYGVIVNSFYELEPAYVDYYRKVMGIKAWHIGPVWLCNREDEDKAQRGKESSIDEHECLKWLDSKKPNSVVYVCFGSITNFPASQLLEIATGLEASGLQFIWVVRKEKCEQESEEWLPVGYEERLKGKGLIVRGWAPQVLILDHKAVGGFVTHCGWNSTIEGVSAGLPMVTWPLFAEQFFNEKLVTDVLKIGVGVGAQKWSPVVGDSVKREAIEKVVSRIMVGEEAEQMRSRARSLREMSRKAIEEGGSSYSDLNALIQELRSYCS